MPRFKIMDQTGHTTDVFDKADVMSLEAAEKRFEELTGKGFRAVAMSPAGEGALMKSFDATVEDVVFIPQLQGG